MSATQPNLQLLAIFVAVVEEESFSKAAKRLGVGKGTVSRSIARLEENLGVALLNRTTHHVSLTLAGAALYERTGQHIAALHKATTALPELDEEPSGLLRMTAPPDLGVMVLPSLLTTFARRYPLVRFDIRLTGERVDLLEEGFDLAIRATASPTQHPELKVQEAGTSAMALYASPSYIARHGKPKHISDKKHTWVLHTSAAHFLDSTPEVVRFIINDFFLARDLICEGVGAGILPTFVAKTHVRDGLLEEIQTITPERGTGQLLLLSSTRSKNPRSLKVFCDFFLDAIRKGL